MNKNIILLKKRLCESGTLSSKMRQNFVTLLGLVVVVSIVHNGIVLVDGLRCDRAPEGSSANKSPPDGRFRLRILGDPDRYIPGENYTSKL